MFAGIRSRCADATLVKSRMSIFRTWRPFLSRFLLLISSSASLLVVCSAPASAAIAIDVTTSKDSVTINDTAPTTDRYNLSIVAILPSLTQTSAPDLTVSKTHTGNFAQGQSGAAYSITATNIGGAATSGAVTVTDTLPSGLTVSAMSGTNWNCTLATLTCTRTDVLAAGASYPVITLTVTPASVTNTATISGGGETNLSN